MTEVWTAYKAKDYGEANRLANEHISKNINQEQAYLCLGLIDANNNNFGNAINNFQNSLKYNINYYAPYYELGRIHIKLQNTEKAIEYLNKAISLKPDLKQAQELLSTLKIPSKETHRVTTESEAQVSAENLNFGSNSFYSLLEHDKSPNAKLALRLLKELEFDIKPTQEALKGTKGGVIIDPKLFVLLPILFMLSAGLFFVSAAFIKEGLDMPIPIAIIIALLICLIPWWLGRRFYINSAAKNYRYVCKNGKLHITKGVFATKTTIVELYRIKTILVKQSTTNQKTGHAGLLCTTSDFPINMPGFGTLEFAKETAEKMRELSMTLRTLPSIKGTIVY